MGMSRFLNKNAGAIKRILKKKRFLMLLLIFISSLFLVVWNNSFLIFILYIILLVFTSLNIYLFLKNSYVARHLFSDVGRNYAYLVIGELVDLKDVLPQIKESISIMAPNRSLGASFELIKRLYSLLDENKGVLIVLVNKNEIYSRKISAFDLPYLHEVTLNELHIKHSKYKELLPFVFSFIPSILFFIKGMRKRKIEDTECPMGDIVDFCKKRNIKLIFKIVK